MSAMGTQLNSNNNVNTSSESSTDNGDGDVTDISKGSIDNKKQFLRQLAELKQVRDVLLDRIAEKELVWTTSIN